MRRLALVLLAALAFAAGCAPRPVIGPSEADDYVFPGFTPAEVAPAEARSIEQAWLEIRAGNAQAAERRLTRLLSRRPGLPAAETALAYARLRAGNLAGAQRGFDAVLARRPDYVPALVGAATVAVRTGGAEAALAALRRAASLDPGNATVRRRLAEVKLQVTERRVEGARAALQAGDVDKAIEAFRGALEVAPEIAGARLELANLLVDRGQAREAVAVLEGDPEGDRLLLLRLGEILTSLTEHNRALEAYRRILTKDPHDEEAQRGAREVREALELLQMPEEYRRIGGAATISRADLAALLVTKVTALGRLPPAAAKVAIDISGSWARDHIIRALALGILDVYPNHTFQPAATVRRGDLARAVQRVLDMVKWPSTPGPAPSDMTPNNLFHYAASRVVAAGLMDLTPGGAFEAWRPVSGQEAIDVVEGLIKLIGV